jgi:release factor glutamine methyltransferase
MIPTPSTSHVNFNKVYEPAEDSFLFLDALSEASEIEFLKRTFPHGSASPLVCEVGSGSGVVLTFLVSHATMLIGRQDTLALAIDLNIEACRSTKQTFQIARAEQRHSSGDLISAIQSDLLSSIRPGSVDVLIFNPPYVPSTEIPSELHHNLIVDNFKSDFEKESNLLALSYAGGVDGMETTNRLLASLPSVLNPVRGIAYILFCARNKPKEVERQIASWGPDWNVKVIAHSGKKAGWEVLQILRIWRDNKKGNLP